MSKKCKGCGSILQNEDVKKIGYSPKIDSEYCQRCFRLKNYDDLSLYVTQGESDAHIYEQIYNMDALVCYVVDLFDFKGTLIDGLQRHIGDKDVLLIGTKRDLLPTTLSDQKLLTWIRKEIKSNIRIKGIVVCAHKGHDGVDNLAEAIEILAKNRPVVFMGCANVGKSTLINALMNKDDITTSRYPGTTIDMIELNINGRIVYDTPGVMRKDNIIHYLALNDLKNVVPSKALKPRVYQLYEPQSLSIGGICRFDFETEQIISIACYFNDAIKIHRGKLQKADELWEKHYNELLVPTLKDIKSFNEFTRKEYIIKANCKNDIMINGLGWISIHTNHKQKVVLYIPKMLGVEQCSARI